jgi:hypothetical protein
MVINNGVSFDSLRKLKDLSAMGEKRAAKTHQIILGAPARRPTSPQKFQKIGHLPAQGLVGSSERHQFFVCSRRAGREVPAGGPTDRTENHLCLRNRPSPLWRDLPAQGRLDTPERHTNYLPVSRRGDLPAGAPTDSRIVLFLAEIYRVKLLTKSTPDIHGWGSYSCPICESPRPHGYVRSMDGRTNWEPCQCSQVTMARPNFQPIIRISYVNRRPSE